MNLRTATVFILITSFCGCTTIDTTITKALTTSPRVKLEPIDHDKAIVKYDTGALIEPNGRELAEKTMKDFFSNRDYRTITSGNRVSGEKRHTITVVFECLDW